MDRSAARELDAMTGRFYDREAASFSETRQGGWPGWELLLPWLADARRATAAVEKPAGEQAAAVEKGAGEQATTVEKPAAAVASDATGHPAAAVASDATGRPAVAVASDAIGRPAAPLTLLDVGCGNFRFERWLQGRWGTGAIEAVGLDRCAPLAADPPPRCTLVLGDVTAIGTDIPGSPGPFGAAVAFGLIHHLPLASQRLGLLATLTGALAPGGIAVVSCWRFLEDPRLGPKARVVTEAWAVDHPDLAGQLGEGDAILGWQGSEKVHRFCHQVDEGELDGLVAELRQIDPRVRELARFSADGRSGRLNRYLVLGRE